MYILATTAALGLISQFSSTLPTVYVAATGTITGLGFPTLGIVIEPSYELSSQTITEATLTAARPNAIKVLAITP